MTLVRHALIALLMLSMASPALAQDEPLIGGEETPPTPPPPPQPTPPPPAPVAQPAAQPAAQPTAPAAEGAMTPRKKKDITDTDHDMVLGDIGLQVVYTHNIGPLMGGGGGVPTPLTQTGGTDSNTEAVADQPTKAMSGDSQANLGVRYWFTRKVGLDAGIGLFIGKARNADDAAAGFSIYAGVPFALGVYRHLVIFAGPDVGFAFWHPGPDENQWLFNLQGKAGIEVSLGFIDIPRISLMGTFAFGLRIYNDGSDTELVLGNDQGFDIDGLFTTSVGLVFYI
jgi:hypothetical protein